MTRAPAEASARAVARPMPREAPVTRAVLLMRSVMVVLLFGRGVIGSDSGGGPAAVDVDDLAGDERGLRGGGKDDGVRDLLGLSGALERDAREHAGLAVDAAGKAIQHRGLYGTWRHGVDAHAERGRFERGGLGKPLHGMLAGRIKRSAGGSALSHRR